MNKKNTTLGNYAYNMAAAVWEAITDISITGIIARSLNVNDFGNFAFISALVASFRVLCGASVPVIITREIAVDKSRTPQVLSAGLFINAVMSFLTLLVVMLSVNVLSGQYKIVRGTFIAMTAGIFDFSSLVLLSVVRGYERMEYAAYRVLIVQTVFFVMVIGLVKLDHASLFGFMTVYALAYLLGLIYSAYIVLTKFARPSLPLDFTLCKYIFMESYPIALRRFIRRVGFRIDTILLRFLSENKDAGFFHGAYKITQGLMFIGEAFVSSVFPSLSKQYAKSKESVDKLYERSFRFLAASGCLLGVPLFTFSNELATLVLGEKYLAAAPVLRVFSGIIPLMFLTKLAERMLIVGKQQVVVTVITLVCLLVNVVFDLLLIPSMGIMGASIATVVAEAVLFALGLYYTNKYVSRGATFVCILKLGILFFLTCAITLICETYVGRVASYVVGPIVYVAGAVLMGLFRLEDFEEIRRKLRKKTGINTPTSPEAAVTGPGESTE